MAITMVKDTVSKDRFFKSKLVALFKTLSKAEVKAFAKYLGGTSYKPGNAVFHLFNFLKKHHPKFCESKVNTYNVWHYVFDANEINQKKLLQLRTNLVKVLEDFLIKLQLEKSQPERDFLLLNALKDRKLDNQFFQKVKEVRKKWEKDKPPGIEQLHNEYKLEILYSSHLETVDIEKISEGILGLANRLDNYYFALRLHYFNCIKISENYVKTHQIKQNTLIIKNILSTCESKNYQNIPQIRLSSKITNTLISGKYDNFHFVKALFYENFKLYDKDEREDILNFLMYFCAIDEEQTLTTSNSNLFELSKWAVDNKLYVDKDYFDVQQFQNIVNIAISAKKLDWAINFIEDYKNLLPKKIRVDIVPYCMITCLLKMGKFENILEKLLTIRFSNVNIGVTARCIQMRAYTELNGKDEEFYGLAKSFKVFLKRDIILQEQRKKSVFEFIKYNKIIYELRYNNNKHLHNIKEQIEKSNNVFFKNWLLYKIEKYSKEAN